MYYICLGSDYLRGILKIHKKTKLHYFEYSVTYSFWDRQKPLSNVKFNTKLAAKLWLLQHSSFPRFNEYIPTILDQPNPEAVLDKLILKKNYKLKSADSPLLCECVIYEDLEAN